MKSKLLILLAAVFSSYGLSGQNNAAGDLIPNEFDFFIYAQQMANKPGKKLYLNQLNDYSNIDGSPFWFDDELLSQVVQINGDRINNVPILFDQFKREILAKSDNGQIILLDESMYHEIAIIRGLTKEIFQKVHPSFPSNFYQVLYANDDMILFKDIAVKLNESASSYVGLNDKIREFRRKTSYFIRNNGTVKEIPFKKKKFYGAFTKVESDRMKKYAKQKGIKLKKEDDFISLVKSLHEDSF